jgi:putative ABC transport system substrate-binding protein
VRRIGVLMAYAESDREAQTLIAAFRDGLQKVGWQEGHNIRIDTRWAAEVKESMQQPKLMARIGALYIGLADADSFKKELREGLRELGYVEGQNIAFEFRSAEGKLDRLPELASELVRLKVDVIVALYVPSGLAAKQATREIPIVIIAADPVETGIVASLARPGGNITGVSLMSAVLIGKCVELFRDMLATTRKVALLTNAADPLFAKLILDQVESAGRITGIEIQPITLRGPDEELDAAFAAMARGRADAVVIQGSLSTRRIADLALAHHLPAASTTRAFADAGGLMSYGADGPALFRQGAKFVHRILQGHALLHGLKGIALAFRNHLIGHGRLNEPRANGIDPDAARRIFEAPHSW